VSHNLGTLAAHHTAERRRICSNLTGHAHSRSATSWQTALLSAGKWRQSPGAPRHDGPLHVEAASGDFNPDALHKHIHGVLVFDDGRRLVFTDPRTFGALGVARELPFLQAMGPEPLDDDFDEDALARKLSTRKTKLKAALLDQKLVAGLGNIYADEVCFLAGVHPAEIATNVPLKKLRAVVSHMRPVLERAIANRGATLKDGGYQDTFGAFGEYRPHVYGNTKEPCGNCATPIERGVLGPGKSARSYHFCPKCQRMKGR
jgi:formamidopyrimidine-DNA glycosylase